MRIVEVAIQVVAAVFTVAVFTIAIAGFICGL